MLSSASVVQAQKEFGSSSYYWQHQLFWGVIPGIIAMLVLWRIDYRHWKKAAFPVLFLSFLLLALVFVPHIGLRLKGATSWITVLGVSFQPAEFLKFALVLYLAAWLGEHRERLKNWQLGLLPFVIVMGFIGTLLLLQPDLGTLGLVLIIAGGVYFIAGAPLKQTILIGLAVLILIIGFARASPHRWARVKTLMNPMADARGAGWQLNQSLIAIGSGGVWGVGLGQSTQKFGFLPEPIGDSIFAILIEELGVVGGSVTIGLFALLSGMLIWIARKTADPFGSLFTSGMLLWITTQAVVNIAAITGLGPLTGVPLPFISYGGTAMISMLGGLGVVLNIAERI